MCYNKKLCKCVLALKIPSSYLFIYFVVLTHDRQMLYYSVTLHLLKISYCNILTLLLVMMWSDKMPQVTVGNWKHRKQNHGYGGGLPVCVCVCVRTHACAFHIHVSLFIKHINMYWNKGIWEQRGAVDAWYLWSNNKVVRTLSKLFISFNELLNYFILFNQSGICIDV
jgi:hypothetical protein